VAYSVKGKLCKTSFWPPPFLLGGLMFYECPLIGSRTP